MCTIVTFSGTWSCDGYSLRTVTAVVCTRWQGVLNGGGVTLNTGVVVGYVGRHRHRSRKRGVVNVGGGGGFTSPTIGRGGASVRLSGAIVHVDERHRELGHVGHRGEPVLAHRRQPFLCVVIGQGAREL